MVRYANAVSGELLGRRVMVRHRLPDGSLTDAVGDLLAWTDDTLTIRSRSGHITVARSAVTAGKALPERVLDQAASITPAELHRVMTMSWQPLETEWLGGWMLRAARGFTGRANSVVPLADPGRTVAAAIDDVLAWYAVRDLPAVFQLPLPIAGELDETLDARGWSVGVAADTMVTDIARPYGGSVGGGRVELAASPDGGWLAAYHYRGAAAPAYALEVLTNHERAVFASVRADGGAMAIGRGAVDGRWLGIAAVEVAPAWRRRGLGKAIVSELLAWGAAQGARHAHLQVATGNTAAAELYAGLGFVVHHQYRYRTAPAG